MKKYLVRNYYTRLICACYAAVFCMVFFAVCLILYAVNNSRINEKLERYDTALADVAEIYESIWDKYYLTFAPIYDKKNHQTFIEFCEEELTGYRETIALENMSRIFAEICLQDERIRGVCFRRCLDDTRYLYFEDDNMLRETELELDGYINVRALPALVGARTITYGTMKEKSVDVFGLQSRELTANEEEKTGKYQITILYDAHCFDQSLREAGQEADERFLILARNGMLIYDSTGDYVKDQASVFEDADKVLTGEESFMTGGVSCLAKSRNVNDGKATVCYVVPQSAVNGIQLGRAANMVLLIAVGIDVMLLVVLLAIKRLFDRKFTELENSISQIGKNNLDYRIPVKGQDEFARISMHFNKMCDDLQTMINKYYVYQMLQQKAEYQALKTRVNPHFLYNSLETIREMLLKGGRQEEADVVVLLSRIFDYQIHSDSVVEIWMETEVLQNYIEFLAIRSMYSFDYKIQMDDGIADYKIPKQILQPVMESCFERVLRKKDPGFVAVCGEPDENADLIRISFRYIGGYANAELADRIRASLNNTNDDELLNLDNVYKRLRIFFGEDCSIQVLEDEEGSEVRIVMTFKKVLSITDIAEERGGDRDEK